METCLLQFNITKPKLSIWSGTLGMKTAKFLKQTSISWHDNEVFPVLIFTENSNLVLPNQLFFYCYFFLFCSYKESDFEILFFVSIFFWTFMSII